MSPLVVWDVRDDWPNCPTPDCEFKQCLWSNTGLCFRCAQRRFGYDELVRLYNETHDITWDEARALEATEGIEP